MTKRTARAKPSAGDDSRPSPRPAFRASDSGSAADAADWLWRVILWQIEDMQKKPSPNSQKAAARARDARTMSELVRTLERLEALEHRRAGDRRKTRERGDAELKARLIGRLDKLAAPGAKAPVSGKPERG